jgi:hypothetical protein
MMVLSAVLGWHTPLVANPVVITHQVYIASEELTVNLTSDAALIDGKFHFISAAKKGSPGEDASVRLMVPIWIPRKASQGDATVATMLDTFSVSRLNLMEGRVREVWDSTIAFKLTIGGKEVPVERFSIFDPASKNDWERLPAPLLHKDFLVLCAWLDFSPKVLQGSPEVHITYRQPLRKVKAAAEFIYVPEFHHMPEEVTTADLKRYAMVLNSKTDSVWFGDVKMQPGQTARLPLSHHQPIKLLVTSP